MSTTSGMTLSTSWKQDAAKRRVTATGNAHTLSDVDPMELSQDQLDRRNHVDCLIYELLSKLAGQELEWDYGMISQVRDGIAIDFAECGIMSEMALYPYIETT